jgi:Fur family peroxide stress response transcriptional regulator
MRKNYSRQRELVLAAVKSHRTHPTADDVYSYLHPHNPAISLSTVYRNLNELSNEGVIKQLDVADGTRHYDGELSDHAHAVCLECGRVFDVEVTIPDLKTEPSLNGFEVTGYSLVVNGICADCQHNAKS